MSDGRSRQASGQTIEEINYLRGFGVLAVIAIHTTGYFTVLPYYNSLVAINLWTDIFAQFAVPLFISISGFVLAKNYRGKFSLLRFYRKRIRAIVPQYVIFSALYTVFNKSALLHNNSLSANIMLLLKSILNSDASYHLWFFAIIIQCYIFYPVIIKIYDFFKGFGKSELLLTLLLIIQTLWMVGMHTAYLSGVKLNLMGFIFYFGIGIYSLDHYDILKRRLTRQTPLLFSTSLALTLGTSLFVIIGLLAGHTYNTIPAYFFIGPELIYPILRLITFLFLYNLSKSLLSKRSFPAKLVHNIGVYSFGIYLIHIFFNQTAIELLKVHNILFDNWRFYPIVYLTTLILSYLSVRLISFLPLSYFLIGYQARKKA